MTLYDLFTGIDRNKFIEELKQVDCNYINKLTKIKTARGIKKLNKTFKQLINLSLNEFLLTPAIESENNSIIFVAPTFLSYNTELFDNCFSVPISSIGKENYQHYSLFGEPDYKLFGYKVSEVSLRMYDNNEKLAAAIYEELTFNGYFKETREKEVKKISDLLKQSEKDIEDGKYEGKGKTVEEVFEELGYKDTRTDKEKKFDNFTMKLTIDYNNQLIDRIVKEEANYLS